MDKNKKWHGVDTNNKTNLFEYGWLIRCIDTEAGEYDLIFKKDDRYYQVQIIHQILYQDRYYHFEALADNECMPEDEYAWKAAHNIIFFIESLSALYGLGQILPHSYEGKTEQEIRKQLTSAL